jgi:hypothetical protein
MSADRSRPFLVRQCSVLAAMRNFGSLRIAGFRPELGWAVDGRRREIVRVFYEESWCRVMRQNTAQAKRCDGAGKGGDAGELGEEAGAL